MFIKSVSHYKVMKTDTLESIESLLKNIKPSDLKEDILGRTGFVLEHFGQPCDYFSRSNEKVEDINVEIAYLKNLRLVLFDESNEDIIKKLYFECSGNEDTSNDSYKEFYIDLNNSLKIWYYGDRVYFGLEAGPGEYTELKTKISYIQNLMNRGKPTSTEKLTKKYQKELSDKSNSHYQ